MQFHKDKESTHYHGQLLEWTTMAKKCSWF